MAYKCQLCGKGIQYGHRVSHSKRRTRRIFKPNLHRVRVLVSGQMKRLLLCTKCLRSTKVKPTVDESKGKPESVGKTETSEFEKAVADKTTVATAQ